MKMELGSMGRCPQRPPETGGGEREVTEEQVNEMDGKETQDLGQWGSLCGGAPPPSRGEPGAAALAASRGGCRARTGAAPLPRGVERRRFVFRGFTVLAVQTRGLRGCWGKAGRHPRPGAPRAEQL